MSGQSLTIPIRLRIAVNTVWTTVHTVIHSHSNFQDAINSIRRLAAERLQANYVSLLWRHSSWVRLKTLEHAYRKPFLTVLLNLNPKMLSAIVWTPKRHLLTSQRVFWTIVSEIPWPGYFIYAIPGKKMKKRAFTFHVFRQALPYGRLAQILDYMFVLWT